MKIKAIIFVKEMDTALGGEANTLNRLVSLLHATLRNSVIAQM
jgi:hypothetical protein